MFSAAVSTPARPLPWGMSAIPTRTADPRSVIRMSLGGDLARHRRDGPGDRPEQRRLARPGRTREGEEGAGRDDEVDRIDRHQLAVPNRHPAGHHRTAAPRLPAPPWRYIRALERSETLSTGGVWTSGRRRTGRGGRTGSRQSRSAPSPVRRVHRSPSRWTRTRVPGWQVVEDVVRKGQRPVGGHDGILLAAPALAADPAVADGDRPRQPGRHLGIVGDEDDGRADLPVDLVETVENQVARLVVELAGRLVGEQQPGQRRDSRRPARSAGSRPGRQSTRGERGLHR